MAYSHAIFEDTGKSTMPTDEKFVTAGILKYLSQSAICLGAACMTLALPVQARTEKTDHSKVVVKKHVVTKNKSSHDDDEEDAAPKRKASARSSCSLRPLPTLRTLRSRSFGPVQRENDTLTAVLTPGFTRPIHSASPHADPH